MKNLLKFSLLVIVSLTLTNCQTCTDCTSSLTGWKFNNPDYGNYIKGNSFEGSKPPGGMVAIEGGTFTMGQVQDDVMFDWNTTPKKMHIRSFYMDEAEVTNAEYLLFTQYTKDVFPPDDPKYKYIYNSVLPDTLVWRKGLGNTDLLSENYLRHPAYANYPVVGVSWLQATQYCKWRTNAVNLKILMDKGVIKNIWKMDSINFKGKNVFDTDVYLENPYALFDGDSTIYKKGLPSNIKRKKGQPKPKKGAFTGRQVTFSDGILAQKYRLPTEAEWEYAAKSIIETREYNNLKGRKKYTWTGKYTRDKSKRYKGDQLANFKQSKGNYSGIAGWSSDGSDIPIKVKSYPPNAFGLYDMSGNVAEWVADVYRPNIDVDANDFNYYRGNVFTKKMINKEGKVVIVDENSIEYDTLDNGKIIPLYLPGSIKYVPTTKDDIYMRRNYSAANNSNLGDGNKNSSRFYQSDLTQFENDPAMYNSPKTRRDERDSVGNILKKYDTKFRSTLIGNNTRVYKGGSWSDREYWLDPAQRRYLPEYMSTNFIGFRCVTDKVGPMTYKKKTARNARR
ncbi:Serine/threonine-protein kinase pkn1 [Polaribacter huanghezhanensis]|uniref:gliding motility lipoprotein GldJ n=1 Tax=Polaribacter huanghezhanensis TaxID=1354726 RepID=UPI00264722B4|nr:gliding motility lipoprotein GldJ [Polaribacter huanghezhanensis]WKD86124.1 Serine/threonine-protein kinase pkn1 [Polaribacter huanghezhanensis]